MEKENILGFDVSTILASTLVKKIFDDFNKNISNFIVNINPEIVTKNYKNNKFKNILNAEKYQIPDGIGIVLAYRLHRGKIKERISGIDLMNLICQKSINYDVKIFLYGSKDGIAEKAKEELELAYPGINIVGTCSGYLDEQIVVNKIIDSEANILFVGLGSPKQENFIIENINKLKNIKACT